MNTTTARFRLPSGEVRRGWVVGETVNGYRKAYIKVCDFTIAGRVSAKRGFSEYDRIHKFEVNMAGSNARFAFFSENEVYAVAA